MDNKLLKDIKLTNGFSIPYIGMGTWPIRGKQMENVMEQALEVGYRMFDTADNYGNEDAIGNVIKRHPSLRSEIRIMTKLSDEKNQDTSIPWSSTGKYFYKTSAYMKTHTVKQVVDMLVEKSLKNLQTDYIDVLIMHWPYIDYIYEIWEEMIHLYNNGIIKSIGVSNFSIRHLDLLKKAFDITPMVNQISISPIDTKSELLSYGKSHNIQTICYAPIRMATHPYIINNPIALNLCEKYNVSISKLLLLWNLSQGIIPIPKTTSKTRMLDNLCREDTMLYEEDITLLNQLNRNYQYLPESMYCPGL